MYNLKSHIILILLLVSALIYAHDFSQRSPSGSMLYYNIVQEDSLPYTVEVTISPAGRSYSGDIIIPDTLVYDGNTYYVTSIAPHAFAKSERLTSIELPSTLVSIGSNAFRDCIRLQSITFPEYLTYIGGYCLVNCVSLKSIGIPQYVNYIGTFAFGNCKSLHNIYVDMDNENYSTIAGILFDKTGQELIHYPALRDGEHFEIPEFVNFIADWAFCGAKNLKSVYIPQSVISIGRSAFWGCKNITTIEIPNSVDIIKSHTFFDCKNLNNALVSKSTKVVSTAFPPYTKIKLTKKRDAEEEKNRPKVAKREKVDIRPTNLPTAILAEYNERLLSEIIDESLAKDTVDSITVEPDLQLDAPIAETPIIQRDTIYVHDTIFIIQDSVLSPTINKIEQVFEPDDINIEEMIENEIYDEDITEFENTTSPTGDDNDDVIFEEDFNSDIMDQNLEDYLSDYEEGIEEKEEYINPDKKRNEQHKDSSVKDNSQTNNRATEKSTNTPTDKPTNKKSKHKFTLFGKDI